MLTQLRNLMVHAVHDYESHKRRSRQGRHRKLTIAYILNRIFYVCKTGCQWSQLEVPGSSFKTIYHHFNIWSKAHVFENAFYQAVNSRASLGSSLVVDTSYVKNVFGRDVTGRNPTDRGRQATKTSLMTDSFGTPLCCVFHEGNKSDALTLRHLLHTALRKNVNITQFDSLLGDKGYDSSTCRSLCATYNLQPLIPKRRTKDTYHGRFVIEQTFGILDQFRRVRVRYECLLRNFNSFHIIALAAIVMNR